MSEVVSIEAIRTWKAREREYISLLKHPQLKISNRVCGLEEVLRQISELIKAIPPEIRSNFTANEQFNSIISLAYQDITTVSCDAIVNAAHSGLTGGGGIDGIIHSRATSGLETDELLNECLSLAPCNPGECKITKGYQLPSQVIIHTVGPYGENSEILSNCYYNALDCLVSKGLKTIAFCCISTGHYKYPIERACFIALSTVRKWLQDHISSLDSIISRILFCVHSVPDEVAYEELLPIVFPFH